MKTIHSVLAGGALALACVLAPSVAAAHATLEVREARAGSTYKAVLRVPHGCAGEATRVLRVRIPEGMISVKPMPKAGWDLEIVTGPLARPYTSHGTEVTEGVVELIWRGELLDAHYDEFVFRGSLTDAFPPGTTVHFPTVQECDTGAERWIEIPAEGQSGGDLRYPAPALRIVE
ncbi:YcnI family copper-binding membrane protein [Salinarimonas sp. NSM]|uniref:YcnI family copper-binding membrane protein n=1 Tax=Salinarimonas sp. NSM TaxID=3458003 RepID=UPI00403727DA